MTHKDFLFYVLDRLEENNVPYVLMCGTLLGAIREKDFLASDAKDTDIAIDDQYYWKVRQIFDKEVLANKCRWLSLLRKEITVANTEYTHKVDIFAMEAIDHRYAVYSYKPNKQDKKWNHEWRAFFTKDNFFPAKQIDFLGRQVSVPKNAEKVLTEEYSDWRTPKPTWISSDNTVLNADKNYSGFYPAGILGKEHIIDTTEKEIGFICINFLRKDCTKKCIQSLKEKWPNVKVYVADQDEPSGDMIQFYEANNVEYYYMPYDCGLSVCRNFLVEKVQEPYLMWGDNDFIYNSTSGLDKALIILKQDHSIGFVGGAITKNGITQHYERILSYMPEHNILVYVPLELINAREHNISDIKFYDCDLTFNNVICNTKLVQENINLRWCPELKVRYEHSDMFLSIKQYSKKRVVYCPSLTVIHAHDHSNQSYNNLRLRKDADKIFADKWGLKMNFTVGKGCEVYGKENIDIKELMKRIQK